MPRSALPDTDLPIVLTVYDRADPPRGELLAGSEPLEIGGGRNLWAARLDEAVRRADRPVILAAHGVSCFAVAWWAKLSPASYVEKVAGALFLDPLGAVTPGDYAGPKISLPFPSLLVGKGEEMRELARGWGSRLFDRKALPSLRELIAAAVTPVPLVQPALARVRRAVRAAV